MPPPRITDPLPRQVFEDPGLSLADAQFLAEREQQHRDGEQAADRPAWSPAAEGGVRLGMGS